MKTIAIVAGGNSSEFEVSVKSASEVYKILSSEYKVYIVVENVGVNLMLI